MTRTLVRLAIACALSGVTASSSVAATVPLSDLLVAGAAIQSGDKIFTDFTYNRTGDMPTADQINVITLTDPNGDFGLRFQGGFVDQAGGSSSDALVTFNVAVDATSGMVINGATLRANPAVVSGTGLASITETFLDPITDEKLVTFDFGNGDDKLLDRITFDRTFQTLPVQKDIILHATGEQGAVTLTFIDQTFSQIPEPSSLCLLAFGLLGLVFRHRRR